mmetsp:Transcript_83117/g.164903  ORF Transcript_83117/g.164903 Transcript_83117/m.164903 type:complete len:263 (-) Transcript_83117:106-894(-)|eukprot:CAMPEP_0172709910 /NCGR_PEP_ID=MMETSP1074-20121228/55345_1 /TAXON_ID=2916 /ORGANISM="Ceratium fusus, Strain PA161109" /LENGTH=262 /DNA_ID=CAMNT_0013533233 /DNA_START=20 /DNA_END=808 /DNA_ORIENTATION=-
MRSRRLEVLAAYILQACTLSAATSETYHTAHLEQMHSAVLVSSGGALEVLGSTRVHHRALVRRGTREGSHLRPSAQSTDSLNSSVQRSTTTISATGRTSDAQGAGVPKSRNEGCYDQEATGLCLAEEGVSLCHGDVLQAPCSDLAHYCNLGTMHGSKIREKCLRTCGFCEPQLDVCIDGEPNEEPKFELNAQLAHCRDLGLFCRDEDGEIAKKCKQTCGACSKSTTTSSTAENFMDTGTCSRRRSMGFCFTRRRDAQQAPGP